MPTAAVVGILCAAVVVEIVALPAVLLPGGTITLLAGALIGAGRPAFARRHSGGRCDRRRPAGICHRHGGDQLVASQARQTVHPARAQPGLVRGGLPVTRRGRWAALPPRSLSGRSCCAFPG